MGLKLLLVERVFDKPVKHFDPSGLNEYEEQGAAITYFLIHKSKLTFMAVLTLSGFVPLIIEIYVMLLKFNKK